MFLEDSSTPSNQIPKISFRGDDSHFIELIANKFGITTDGITEVTNSTDRKQASQRIQNMLDVKLPGATIKFNSTLRTPVIGLFVNEDLDVFGFCKVVEPVDDNMHESVAMVPFYLKPMIDRLF
jgi:hypothetical protein